MAGGPGRGHRGLCGCLGEAPGGLPSAPTPARGRTHPEVDDGHVGAVRPAHDAVQVLQARGQEGAEGPRQPRGPRLLEALEVGTADAAQAARLRPVQRDQVQLRRRRGQPPAAATPQPWHPPQPPQWAVGASLGRDQA